MRRSGRECGPAGRARATAAGGVHSGALVEDGDWFADCPVVLDFDGLQVEVCHSKLELSIGWDTIDTAATITGWECLINGGSVDHGDAK